MKRELIIKLSSGQSLDWFSLSRKKRREILSRNPSLKKKIEAALAEADAEQEKGQF